MKIQRSKDMKGFMNMLVYADPGDGKTSLAATAAMSDDMSDVLFLVVEGGMLTVRDMPNLKHDPLVIHVNKPSELEEVFWALKKKSEELAEVQTVVLDSASELVAKDLENTVTGNLAKTSRSGKRRSGPDDAWLEDRGEVSMRTARILRWYRDLDMHFIATAHANYVYPKGKDDEMPQYDKAPVSAKPSFGPKLCQQVCGYMDFVWYLKRAGDRVRILAQPSGPYFAKTRGDQLARQFGRVIEWKSGDPLLPAIYDTMYNGADFPYRLEENVHE